MAYSLGSASRAKLQGVHPDLVRVVERAIELTPIDFRITCGLRTLAEQQQLVAEKKSKTLKSRHLTGHAIDFVALPDGKPSWNMPLYVTIAAAFKRAAAELGVKIECGADWGWDGPHVELDRKVYPAK